MMDDVEGQRSSNDSPQGQGGLPLAACETSSGNRRWLLVFALVVITLVAYQPVWHAGFIWDDDDHLTANPAMTDPRGLRMVWSSLEVSRYYPLTLTTFWIAHRLWGFNPLPYHLLNVTFHALNAALLFFLLSRLRVRGAWLAALIWAVHPVNVETAAWVTEMKNTQSGLFFLLALLLYLHFEDGLRWRDYWLTLVCGAAAMLSKPSTVVLPGVMLLCTWWRQGKWKRADFVRVAPLVALAAGMSLLTVIEQRYNITIETTHDWTLTTAQRLVLAGKAMWFYAGKVVWPVDVCYIYPRWELQAQLALAWLPLAGLALATFGLWRFRRERWARAGLFGAGCFTLALLPVLGFFDIYFFRYSFVADHFQYLASAAGIALVIATVTRWSERAGRMPRTVGRLVAILVVMAFGVLTWRQSSTYADAEHLYRATIARNPSCWMAYCNLGGLLLEQGRLVEAVESFQQALRFKTDDGGVYNNLGTGLFRQGRLVEAEAQYRTAVQLKPKYAEAHYNLGNVASELGQLDEAVAQYRRAIELDGNRAEAHYNLANTLLRQSQPAQATEHYRAAARLQPGDADIQYSLAGSLAQQGNLAEAITRYQLALQIKPDHISAHYNLANALLQLGQPREAVAHYRKALRLQPDLLAAEFNLASALLNLGNTREAIEHFQRTVALKPDLAQAHYQLAVAWAKLGNFANATNCCDRALRLRTELPQALADCAWLLATREGATSQDTKRAVELAKRACLTGTNEPSYLDALAAAYASDGQFSNAVFTAERAFTLANNRESMQLKQQIADRLNLYRAGQPYRAASVEFLPSDW